MSLEGKVGRPRVNPDTPLHNRQREAQLRYYRKHREERLLKASLYKSREDVRAKIRETYHKHRDEIAQATGVPRRPPGKPRATVEARMAGLAVRAEMAGLGDMAEAIRARLYQNLGQTTQSVDQP